MTVPSTVICGQPDCGVSTVPAGTPVFVALGHADPVEPGVVVAVVVGVGLVVAVVVVAASVVLVDPTVVLADATVVGVVVVDAAVVEVVGGGPWRLRPGISTAARLNWSCVGAVSATWTAAGEAPVASLSRWTQ
jgi:hypothetical protein